MTERQMRMRTEADEMVEMHEKSIGKQQLCGLLDDLIDVRCDGKLRLTDP
jgi:hypothetical protein